MAWTDADIDAARLAMELECLLLATRDTAAQSRWWDSAHEALELHRQRLREQVEPEDRMVKDLRLAYQLAESRADAWKALALELEKKPVCLCSTRGQWPVLPTV